MDIALKAQKGGDHDTQQDKAGGVAGGSPMRWGGGHPTWEDACNAQDVSPSPTYIGWGLDTGDASALALTQSSGRRWPWELLLSGLF